MISQLDQALLQIEATRAQDSKDLELLKALAWGTKDTMLWGFLMQTCPTPHTAMGMHCVECDPGRWRCKTCLDLVLSGPSGGSYNPVFTWGSPCCRMPPMPILVIPIFHQG